MKETGSNTLNWQRTFKSRFAAYSQVVLAPYRVWLQVSASDVMQATYQIEFLIIIAFRFDLFFHPSVLLPCFFLSILIPFFIISVLLSSLLSLFLYFILSYFLFYFIYFLSFLFCLFYFCIFKWFLCLQNNYKIRV